MATHRLRAGYWQISPEKRSLIIISLAEISTEREYLRLSLKVHSPKEPAGFINPLATHFRFP